MHSPLFTHHISLCLLCMVLYCVTVPTDTYSTGPREGARPKLTAVNAERRGLPQAQVAVHLNRCPGQRPPVHDVRNRVHLHFRPILTEAKTKRKKKNLVIPGINSPESGQVDHDLHHLDILTCRNEMLCKICEVQIQPRNLRLDHA